MNKQYSPILKSTSLWNIVKGKVSNAYHTFSYGLSQFSDALAADPLRTTGTAGLIALGLVALIECDAPTKPKVAGANPTPQYSDFNQKSKFGPYIIESDVDSSSNEYCRSLAIGDSGSNEEKVKVVCITDKEGRLRLIGVEYPQLTAPTPTWMLWSGKNPQELIYLELPEVKGVIQPDIYDILRKSGGFRQDSTNHSKAVKSSRK
ncbi:MAG: hypothetical protein NTX24_03045 [Candidatus Pacearchaeota archaeon]|nr:hypothetical protein [Candidatus Pacearchaeota archaeon]